MVRLMIRALLVLIVLITTGCNLPGLFSPHQDDRLIPDTGAPWVLIHDPPNGFTAELNVPLLIHSTAADAVGIARIDLLVDGVLARSDETPDGIALLEFSLLQPWIPDRIGDYHLAVIAYRSDGTPSEAAQVAVRVAEAGAVAAAGPDESKACVATALTVLNIRQGPGVRYPIEGSLLIGQKGHVTGRNADGTWWQIDINGGPGWISALHALAEGECDQVAEAAAPPPPTGATPVYRTPVPVNQAGEAPLREANTTGWTFWEVIVDVWVQIFGPGPDDDPGYPPPATPSEGYPPPSATTPAGSTSTNSPEGYPPATDEPD
ncbi:MAG TPA: SH3 domain-containing protein, partial [Anaerolineaceae bacterium]|nr:SH3 domain-containing protein [Anaerolineaceae bacterium]